VVASFLEVLWKVDTQTVCCIVMEVTVLECGSFLAVTGRPYDGTVDWLIDRQDTHLKQISVLEHGPRVSKQCQGPVLGQL